MALGRAGGCSRKGRRSPLHLGPSVSLSPRQYDSARNLEWLKTVKESHGSVELSSLSLATAINSRGVYTIRAPTEGQKVRGPRFSAPSGREGGGAAILKATRFPSRHLPQTSPDTVLRLLLPEAPGGPDGERSYSLDELQELLNKLMLLSGQKEQSNSEVERFSEVRAAGLGPSLPSCLTGRVAAFGVC